MNTNHRTHLSLSLLLLIAPLSLSSTSHATQCDCTEIIGKCIASISVIPTGSQSGLYGADLILRADASSCAKVEYYIDNTPAFTILKNGRFGDDRIMGTSEHPVTSKRVTLESCKICKTQDQVNSERAAQEQAQIDQLVDEAISQGEITPDSNYDQSNYAPPYLSSNPVSSYAPPEFSPSSINPDSAIAQCNKSAIDSWSEEQAEAINRYSADTSSQASQCKSAQLYLKVTNKLLDYSKKCQPSSIPSLESAIAETKSQIPYLCQ